MWRGRQAAILLKQGSNEISEWVVVALALLTTIATARVEFTTECVLVDVDGGGDLDIVTTDSQTGPGDGLGDIAPSTVFGGRYE